MNTINILGLEYTVERVPYISKNEYLTGEIDFIGQKILIDGGISAEKEKVVLLHEVLHGICEGLGLDDLNNDETLIQSLSTALHQCLKDNPILTKGVIYAEQQTNV